MESLKQQFKKIIKGEGHKTITGFINAWIKSGETFESLRDWLALEKGIERDRVTVWLVFRNYLTIPYDYEDQFWYKWNAIAKAKGFKSPQHMVRIFKKRQLCREEMAEELGLKKNDINKVVQRLSKERVEGRVVPKRQYIRHQYKQSRDKDGISHSNRRKVWRERLALQGFRSLRDAVWRLKKRGLTYIEMAEMFGVTVRDFRYRRRRAGL